MFEIAGGIVLALVFLAILPYILVAAGLLLALPFFCVKAVYDDTRAAFSPKSEIHRTEPEDEFPIHH